MTTHSADAPSGTLATVSLARPTLATADLLVAASTVCAHDGADVAALPRQQLVGLSEDLAALRRAADVLMAQVAGEMSRRSQADLGHTGLASQHGFRSVKELVAHTTGMSLAEAGRLVTAGELINGNGFSGSPSSGDTSAGSPTSGDTPSGPQPPAPEPSPLDQVRAAVAAEARGGRIGVDVAALFSQALTDLPDTDQTRELFTRALGRCAGLPLHLARKIVWRVQALANPAAWQRREERQYEQRAVVFRDESDGMVTLMARLTPLAAAPVKAVLDAGVRRFMQQRRDNPGSDTRTPAQMRADLFEGAWRHLLDCDTPTSGVKTTVVVRMTRAELESGLGVGAVDGVVQPVSVGELRKAAADAAVIPMVLGGDSEVLDLGRARRLFTPAQRMALVERDGGCAWCNAPPSWCEAHHIRWWDRDSGPTDLSNGVLLCTRCHHRVHRDGWEIEVNGGVVSFTPPRSVDPSQARRIGGRARFDVAA